MANRTAFIGSMLPYALEASKATGVDPRIIIAQGALESNWGRSAPGNNYFGIKSHGKSGGNTLATTEVINGQNVRVNDSFRSYGGVGDSVRGYADFINSNPRYRDFKGAQGLDAQIDALGRSGYATDPKYSSKISSIARGIDLGADYPATSMPGTMAVASAPASSAPASTPVINTGNANYTAPTPEAPAPEAARRIAGVSSPSKRSIADVFGLLAAQQQAPQIQAAQIQGPSPEQAQALLSVLRNLSGREV